MVSLYDRNPRSNCTSARALALVQFQFFTGLKQLGGLV